MSQSKTSMTRRILEGVGVLGLVAIGSWTALAQQGLEKIPSLESAVINLEKLVERQLDEHEECGQGIRTAKWCHENGYAHQSDMVGPPLPDEEDGNSG